MTAEQVAEHLDARRAGPGKWQAKCPAHNDRSPSLSIKEGDDGTVLLRCWAGCDLAAVLKAGGLTMGSLFAGPPPSPAQLEAAVQERERKAVATAKERASRQKFVEHRDKLSAVVRELGSKLALRPDDDALGRLFHLACERLHEAEHAVDRQTTGEGFVSFVSSYSPQNQNFSIEGAA